MTKRKHKSYIQTPDGPKSALNNEYVDWYCQRMREFDQGGHSALTRVAYDKYLSGAITAERMSEIFDEEVNWRSSFLGFQN